MALSYGLPLNAVLSYCIQSICVLANCIISVERIKQYTHIHSEAPEVIEGNQLESSWPSVGRVDISDLKVTFGISSSVFIIMHSIFFIKIYILSNQISNR